MPDFDNHGATVHYELVGSGPPLLCLAGTASDSASWGPLVPLLADRYRLILIDNRGAGRTRAEGPLALTDMADDAAALLERLGIAEADVIGHSLGGFLTLLLAARHPTRAKRIVTLASGTITNARRVLFRDMARLYFTTPPEDWFRLLYQWLFGEQFFADEKAVADAAAGSTAYPYRQSPADFARQVAAIDAGAAVDLSAVRAPVLAVSAGLDLLASENAVQALHAKLPNVSYRRIETAAHSIHWEAPEAVAAMVREFFR
jgi:pimeloyl-ACP methyl ester carboxylesterase